jgi:hypothetical protein
LRQAFSFSTDCPFTPRNRRNKWFVPTEFTLFRGTGNSRKNVIQKLEANYWNFVPKHFAKKKTTRNFSKTRQPKISKIVSEKTTFEVQRNHLVKQIFFAYIRSFPCCGTDSSVDLGMPRNEHFLPQNKGSRSESILEKFFGTKFRYQPYSYSSETCVKAHLGICRKDPEFSSINTIFTYLSDFPLPVPLYLTIEIPTFHLLRYMCNGRVYEESVA